MQFKLYWHKISLVSPLFFFCCNSITVVKMTKHLETQAQLQRCCKFKWSFMDTLMKSNDKQLLLWIKQEYLFIFGLVQDLNKDSGVTCWRLNSCFLPCFFCCYASPELGEDPSNALVSFWTFQLPLAPHYIAQSNLFPLRRTLRWCSWNCFVP